MQRSAARLILILCGLLPSSLSIGCYRCVALDNEETYCKDPYDAINATYVPNCFAGKRDRSGLFPATYCIKIHGENSRTGSRLYVRDCGLEDMGNMCGDFFYNGNRMTGCILTCTTDGCNTGPATSQLNSIILTIAALFVLIA